jgi:hypothetical protein
LPIINFPPDSLKINIDNIGLAGTEMMQGIEVFLRKEKILNVKSAPKSQEFDIFNLDIKTTIGQFMKNSTVPPYVIDYIKKYMGFLVIFYVSHAHQITH